MKTVRTYVSAFLITSCIFVAHSNQAISFDMQSGKSKLMSLPGLQMIGKCTDQIKNVVLANRCVSASILTGVLVGSYLCFKHFFGHNVTPVAKQNAAPIIKKEVQPLSKQDTSLNINHEIETVENKDAKPITKQEAVLQAKPAKLPETPKSEQVIPVVCPIADKKKVVRVIEVMNDHDQSLSISVSSGNDGVVQQFSVPGYSCKQVSVR